MNPFHSIDPDDPRLTAYALGELAGEEEAQMAAAVAADPALQAEVDEIRAAAGRLTEAFADEPVPQAIRPIRFEAYHTVRPPRFFRWPYWAVATVAMAACVAAVVILRNLPLPWAESPPATGKPVQLAKATAVPEAAVPTAPAPQPHNGFVLEFPKREKKPAGSEPASLPPDALDHIGFVLPNPPAKAGGVLKGGTAGAAAVASSAPARASAVAAPGTVIPESRAEPRYFANQTLAGTRLRGNGAAEPRAYRGRLAMESRLQLQTPAPAFNTEGYDFVGEHGFRAATQNPLSTFSVDVDTASYSNIRRFLRGGRVPPRDAVRIEELVNYFSYGYAPPPADDASPIAASLETASAPWAPSHRLVRIGLKARELPTVERGPANLVFLLDVSGSMGAPDKLPLVQEAMRTLVGELRPDDHVAIVTYAGTSGLALPSTPVAHRQEIIDAINRLHAGGSTDGATGIQLAYDVAKAHFVAGGVNRVILATDGDFNVGVTDHGALVRLIEREAKTGVFLTALGVGTGNYQDATLELLADRGNGTYAYLDSAREARRVLADQVSGTLSTVAKDVKVQVEFNPAKVQAYRLIGYADRRLQKEDFNNDRLDAGDMGAGQAVTALYEVIPVGVAWKPESTVDPLKYQKPEAGNQRSEVRSRKSEVRGQKSEVEGQRSDTGSRAAEGGEVGNELLTVKVRYKTPDGDVSKRLDFPLVDRGEAFAHASIDFKFAAAVAGFGMILRDSRYKGDATIERVEQWARQGIGADAGGSRGEFLSLVKEAQKVLPAQG